jgi:large-conductance mechanosensitive channel
MRDWLSALTTDRIPELALALAVGYALSILAENVTRVLVSALTQNVGRNPYADNETLGLDLFTAPYYLYFTVGGTVIVYGQLLSALIAFALVALAAVLVVKRRDRVLGECPLCASRIPHESMHCAYCGSRVSPGEP